MCGGEGKEWKTAPTGAGASLFGQVESMEGFYSRFNSVVREKSDVDVINEYNMDNDNQMNNDNTSVTKTVDRPIRSTRGKREFLEMSFSGKSYGNWINHSMIANHELNAYKLMRRATPVMFTQMSAKRGIEKFGECAVSALIKEFKQLNEVVLPGKPFV